MYLGGTDPGCHPAISQDMGALIGEFVISAVPVAILNAGNVFIISFRKVFIFTSKEPSEDWTTDTLPGPFLFWPERVGLSHHSSLQPRVQAGSPAATSESKSSDRLSVTPSVWNA